MLPRILLVEDDDALREINELQLELDGFDFKIARHGREALEILDSFDPDIILLDMLMPIMDGVEFMREFQYREARSHVIIFSNMSSPETTAEAMQLGAKHYINKSSYNPDELTAFLKNYWDEAA